MGIDLPLGPALAMAGLGAFHGLNPAMGWLFAVALGLQERQRRAVWRALAALTSGHLLAIGAAIAAVGLFGALIPDAVVRGVVAASLVGLGAARLVRARHPRAGGGMRVGFAGLTAWSFLMASAHGAGLMVLPFVMGAPAATSAHVHDAAHAAHHAAHAVSPAAMSGLAATLLHGAGYLVATALTAWIVYEKLGLGLLRRAWVNLDVLWAAALVGAGLLALVA